MIPLDVSLVICTRNRATQLKTCLEYVSRIETSHAWELIVVDNGSTDDTASQLVEFVKTASFPVRVLFEGVPGKSHALNRAWQAARSQIVGFTDDDCYVAPDYIDKVLQAFTDDKVGFVAGRILLFDPTDYPITIYTSEKREILKPRSFMEFAGANLIFRRQVLEAIGGFDPDLGPGSRFYAGEDAEAEIAASFAGWWGLFTPDVVVYHHHRRQAKAARVLGQRYSIARGAYMAKLLFATKTQKACARHWYWGFCSALRDPRKRLYGFMSWELRGAACYLAYRLRKRLISACISVGATRK